MVESFFDKKAVNAVAVEDEVGAFGVLVSSHSKISGELATIPMVEHIASIGLANLRQ